MLRLIVLYLVLTFTPVESCDAFAIVQNGLINFDAGVTNIGGYTDKISYLNAGVDYIVLRCYSTIP